jgi:TonB family protein
MKYQFVKKRPDISAKEIHGFRDFDAVLTASQQVTGLTISAKLLWGLAAVSIIGLVYFLTINQTELEKVATAPSTSEVAEATRPEAQKPIERTTPERDTKPETKTKPEVAKPEKSETPEKQVPTPQHQGQQEPKPKTENEVRKEDVYLNAEPVDGFELFYAFIESELTYPELARKDSIKGHVKVMFSIDVDGSIKDITVVEPLGELFDNEAIRVIKRSPPWKPATFNGYPVSSRMSIKLSFKAE